MRRLLKPLLRGTHMEMTGLISLMALFTLRLSLSVSLHPYLFISICLLAPLLPQDTDVDIYPLCCWSELSEHCDKSDFH